MAGLGRPGPLAPETAASPATTATVATSWTAWAAPAVASASLAEEPLRIRNRVATTGVLTAEGVNTRSPLIASWAWRLRHSGTRTALNPVRLYAAATSESRIHPAAAAACQGCTRASTPARLAWLSSTPAAVAAAASMVTAPARDQRLRAAGATVAGAAAAALGSAVRPAASGAVTGSWTGRSSSALAML